MCKYWARYSHVSHVRFSLICPPKALCGCQKLPENRKTIVLWASDINFAASNKNVNNMDIVIIEKKAFDLLLESVKALNRKVELLEEAAEDKILGKWMDNEEVCRLLNVCPRTLQELRDKQEIACTQVNRKFFYRPTDVESFIKTR